MDVLALLERRAQWFDQLTPSEKHDHITNRRPWPDGLRLGYMLPGGCKRSEDAGHLRETFRYALAANYVIAGSKGTTEASFLGNIGKGRVIYENLDHRFSYLHPDTPWFGRSEDGHWNPGGLFNLFKIYGYDLFNKARKTEIGQAFLNLNNDIVKNLPCRALRLSAVQQLRNFPPPIDMDGYFNFLIARYGTDDYQRVYPEIIFLATRESDGKQVGFKINHLPPHEMRRRMLASSRLVGIAGDPVTIKGAPDYVVGMDGKLEAPDANVPQTDRYFDEVFSGHPIRMAAALNLDGVAGYLNRAPELLDSFDSQATEWVLTGFVKRVSLATYKNYKAAARETKELLLTGARDFKIATEKGAMLTSMIHYGQALTCALESSIPKLLRAYEAGRTRGMRTVEIAQLEAAMLPSLPLPVRAVPKIAAQPQRPAYNGIVGLIYSVLPPRPSLPAWLIGRKAAAAQITAQAA